MFILPNGPWLTCPSQTRDAAIARLLRWYMRTADAAGTAVVPHRYNIPLEPAGDDPPPLSFASAEEALAWYDGERVNLVAATRQAAESGLHEIAWRLPAPLFRVFNSRGNWADCIATNRIALDSARQVGQPSGRGVDPEQPRRGPGIHRRSAKASVASSGRSPSGARSATGWARRRRRTTSPTPITGWDGRMRLSICTGGRWS